jgi:hypothetical protein
MQKNAGEKPLRWLGKTNSRSKNRLKLLIKK